MTLVAPAQPFDAVADQYDASFTDRRLGRWLRAIVWHRLDTAFLPGEHLLELGCGTGEDAVRLAQRGCAVTATDVSPAMLETTRRKAERARVAERVCVQPLDLNEGVDDESASQWNQLPEHAYDGAYSNFGPLNCVEDRPALARALAGVIRPGGKLVLVVMGPLCPWEVGWHLIHGKPRAAIRRFRAGDAARVGEDRTLRVWYPSQRRLQREFAAYFRPLEAAGVGLLLPPTEMGHLVDRWPRFFKRLAALDSRFAAGLPWRWLNDHYVLVLERR
jgi:SAM-dependent methyltransferase